MPGTESGLIRGLEGVVAATTRLCDLDGVNGRLAYQGYAIEDLARHASFEEVVWLLWHGELPARGRPGGLPQGAGRGGAASARGACKVLKLLPKTMHPMRVLQMGVALLGGLDPDAEDNSPEANRRKATRLVAGVSSLTTAFHRIRIGRRPIAPRPDLSHAANFLYTLSGRKPRVVPVRAFDAALVLYAEHELNASTFTARVVASTLSDMHSAVSAAVGALKGSAPRRRGRGGHADARGDRPAGQRGRLHPPGARREAAADGLRAPRLQGRGSAGEDPAHAGREGVPELRPSRSGSRRRSSSTRPSTARRV